MYQYFSDRDPKKIVEHLNQLGDGVEILGVFLAGLKTVVYYKTKEDPKDLKKEKQTQKG